MKSMKSIAGIPIIVLEVLALPGASVAQVTKDQLDAVGAALEAPRTFFNTLTVQQQGMLSGAALNFFHVANSWPVLQGQVLTGQKLSPSSAPSQTNIIATAGPVAVSNPATDFFYSPFEGFTQSETSTAWCGNNVVVGFNDSGSFFESSIVSNFAHQSFAGFARSTNQGLSYTDQGYLPSGTANPNNMLLGDPVVACTDPSTFYYSSLFFTVTSFSPYTPREAVSVSKSTNGGISFGAPVIAVSKDASTHVLDKPWMAVNPANPKQIAVTYTDFDNSKTICPSSFRYGIELVASFDGGARWTSPQVVYTACEIFPNFTVVQASQVAFSPSGAVNVAFELISGFFTIGRQIEFVRAATLGGAFGATVVVTNVTGVGSGFELQGGFRANLDLQGMAVDRSGRATNGNIYIVYHDASDFVRPFPEVQYGYADVMITKSTNNGATWSAPVEVNTNSDFESGFGIDSFMPAVAVDNTSGRVGVCWYDRRNDPVNYAIDRYCGDSIDAGTTFTNVRMTTSSFRPILGLDNLISPSYMGDYDTLTSDFLKTTSGFIGAFQVVSSAGGAALVPNSDVKARSFN